MNYRHLYASEDDLREMDGGTIYDSLHGLEPTFVLTSYQAAHDVRRHYERRGDVMSHHETMSNHANYVLVRSEVSTDHGRTWEMAQESNPTSNRRSQLTRTR